MARDSYSRALYQRTQPRKLPDWKRREKQREVRWRGEEHAQARREDERLMAEMNHPGIPES